MRTYLSFEAPVAEIDAKIDELRSAQEKAESPALAEEIQKLEAKSAKALADLYAGLTPWQKTEVARTQSRPHFNDYITGLIAEFTPLAGDRKFSEDEAIVGGLGRLDGRAGRSALPGQPRRATDTASRPTEQRGFGACARPEGYRKAARLMELAERFDLPVLSLVDTAGAWPGIDAEERGQAEAIARSTDVSLSLGVPNVALVIGEGGSGGALAIATCNKVLMMEHSIYTVASPEAAASILWRDAAKAQDAATMMKITAQDLEKFGIIDGIVTEPVGGAHRDPAATIAAAGRAITAAFASLGNMSKEQIRENRAQKFLAIGRNI